MSALLVGPTASEQEIGIPSGAKLRPIAAIQDWMGVAGIAGRLLRRVDRYGKFCGAGDQAPRRRGRP